MGIRWGGGGGGGRADPNQPMKHSIAHVGELKATFSTGLDTMSDDL